MLNFILRRKRAKPPTAEQIRKAKKLGIKSAAEMSTKSLAVLIAEAEKKKEKAK